jgi:hypothetical protein
MIRMLHAIAAWTEHNLLAMLHTVAVKTEHGFFG